MANKLIGTVLTIQNEAFVKTADGSTHRLSVGEKIFEGDTIITAAGSSVLVQPVNGEPFTVAEQQSELMAAENPMASDHAVSKETLAEFKPTVVDQGDINVEQILQDEATAAGLGAGGENGGSSFVRLMRIVEDLTPINYAFPQNAQGEVLPFNGVVGGTNDPLVEPTVLNLTATPTNITEAGADVLFTVRLIGATFDTDTLVTLTNGLTVTIPAGTREGSVVGTYDNSDDFYIDPASGDVAIQSASNPNAAIDTTPVTINVADTIDDTALYILPAYAMEGGTATYYAVVENAPLNEPLVVTLSNGAVITINVGDLYGMSDPVTVQGDDPYLDGEVTTFTVANIQGGAEYENLVTKYVEYGREENIVYSDHGTTQVFDTYDATTLSVSLLSNDGEATIEGNPLTFRFSVDNAPQGDLILHTTMGDVTIADGTLFADLVVQSRPDENFTQGLDKISVSVISTEGGNYEYLDISEAHSDGAVIDDSDLTIGMLSATQSLGANGGTVTFTVALSGSGEFAPPDDIVFTLTNGDVVKILAGETSGSYTHTYTREEVVNVPDFNVSIADTAMNTNNYEFFSANGTVYVDNPHYEPPVVSIWNDSLNNGVYDGRPIDDQPEIYKTQYEVDPNGTGTDKIFIGDLLLKNNESGAIHKITQADLDANPPAHTVLEHTSNITFTFLSEGAGYMNAVGWYDVNNPSIGHVVWENASAKDSGGSLKAGDHITFDNVPAGTQIGFFLIPDSYHIEGSIPDTIYFNDGHAYKKYDDGTYSKLIDGDDNGIGHSDPVWFSNSTNIDEVQHVVTGISATDAPNVLYVGFEDLGGGGDKDYNDVVFKVDLGEGNNVYRPPVEFDVGVQINDADSTMLSKAVLDFGMMDPEDEISYTPVAGLNVVQDGDKFTITGDASILDYNDLLDSFHLVVGGLDDAPAQSVQHREATLQVWDETGMASNIDTATFDILIPSMPELPKPPIGGDAC